MKSDNGTNAVDNTHLNDKGSAIFGRIVAEDLVRLVPDLAPCVSLKP